MLLLIYCHFSALGMATQWSAERVWYMYLLTNERKAISKEILVGIQVRQQLFHPEPEQLVSVSRLPAGRIGISNGAAASDSPAFNAPNFAKPQTASEQHREPAADSIPDGATPDEVVTSRL